MNSNGQGLGDSEELENVSSTAEPTQFQSQLDMLDNASESAATDNGTAVEPPPENPPAPPRAEIMLPDAALAAIELPPENPPAPPDAALAAEATADSAVAPQPAEGDWLAQDMSDLKQLKKGDILEGTVTATSPTAVYVDVGAKTEGIIPARELERMNRETLEMLKPGEKINVFVVNPNTQPNGDILLSLNRALEEMDWRSAEAYRENQEVYESHVAGYNKGGLIVRFGRLRGFVPQSQISPDRRRVLEGETPEERWGKMVNETITIKVMEVDRSRNRLILSERMASRESRESRKESLIGRLQVGEVRVGKVVSLVDFGVFVDIGGAEGLVHLTELSWKHVNHPRDFLKVGQEVKVEVINIDPENKRIGLSMKRQEADPWDTVAINFQVGQLVQGVVTKMTKFGAFVRLVDVPEIEGLVHISELSDQRVVHPRDVLQDGETVTLRVVKIDIEDRRLGLSLKRVNSAEYLDMDWG